MLYTRQEGNTIPCLSISLAFMKPGIRANSFSQKMERYFSFKSNHLDAISNPEQRSDSNLFPTLRTASVDSAHFLSRGLLTFGLGVAESYM